MKILSFIFVLILTFSLNSCINIIEELRLNKDGSGTYTVRMDMGEAMQQLKALDLDNLDLNLEDSFPADSIDTEEETMPMPSTDDLLGATSSALSEDVDTVFALKDMAMAEQFPPEEESVLNKVFIKTKFVESEDIYDFAIELRFDDISEIDLLYQTLNDIMKEQKPDRKSLQLPAGGLFSLKGKKLERRMMEQEFDLSELGDEDENLQMAMLFLGAATYKRVYQFPGNVKKCSNSLGVVEGNTVTMEVPLMNMLEGKANLDATIKYKKGK